MILSGGLKPYIVLFIGVVSVSFAAIFIRLADAPALVIAASRVFIAFIIILPFTFNGLRKELSVLRGRNLLLIFISAVFLSIHFWLWITSLERTTVASSVVLVTSNPAFIAILSYILWKERLSRMTIVGIIIAFLGMVLLNKEGLDLSQEVFSGNIMALLAGFAAGIYIIIGRQMRDKIGIWPYLTMVYGCAAVMLIIIALISGESFTGYDSETYLMLVLLALVPQLIGHSAVNYSVRYISATIVSIGILGEPVGATILGYFVLNEIPLWYEIAGGILIICGIALVVKYSAKNLNQEFLAVKR